MISKVPSCAFSVWTLPLKLTQHFDLIYNIGKSWNILQNITKTAQDSYTILLWLKLSKLSKIVNKSKCIVFLEPQKN